MHTKHLEVVTYTHKGVDVTVQIDYDNELISLVKEQSNSVPKRFDAKQWVFANRGLDYMEGWQDILAAMSHAVAQATDSLSLISPEEVGDAKKKKS